jgi:putative ABC transport system ATP-binding protein
MNVSTSMVQVSGLSRTFKQGEGTQKVLHELSFSLQKGEIVALLGRSGSGKSTLLNLLSGIDLPDAGSIEIAHQELTALKEPNLTLFRRQHIGFIFQFFNLLAGLTVIENIALSLELNQLSATKALLEAETALSTVGLENKAHSYPESLSGGEQQRVAILRAMIHKPSLVLADEPTGNLDASTGRTVLQWLCTQIRKEGGTMLLVTHSSEVANSADRTLILSQGQLQAGTESAGW